ncbi:hypothetical protein BP00DRAFT_137857 [Aspergillus indologenus CBS 114.80]|uniref:Uncharacterized protein n=1 Tax=Aspergillus indologenus CBS 114.80 TaxID=1450541 RepID=A0A2V5IFQ0_9EURO|nr:hypothetical protein BP00DRAFT_137857 [Aspergillus indologenus CBS 114.80]
MCIGAAGRSVCQWESVENFMPSDEAGATSRTFSVYITWYICIYIWYSHRARWRRWVGRKDHFRADSDGRPSVVRLDPGWTV